MSCWWIHLWDHPRTRGEKHMVPNRLTPAMGSPPHTRGKALQVLRGRVLPGITPAHAGKRPVAWKGSGVARDHPRTRGEKIDAVLASVQQWGSPPHTRGKAASPWASPQGRRITPAHAGKSLHHLRGGLTDEDHPRTRGEKASKNSRSANWGGSPPHTRGKETPPAPQISR